MSDYADLSAGDAIIRVTARLEQGTDGAYGLRVERDDLAVMLQMSGIWYACSADGSGIIRDQPVPPGGWYAIEDRWRADPLCVKAHGLPADEQALRHACWGHLVREVQRQASRYTYMLMALSDAEPLEPGTGAAPGPAESLR